MKTPHLTLLSDEAVKSGIFRIADTLIDDALCRAKAPGGDPEEVIHFLRTTTKRLRALLQLIRPEIGKTAFVTENARWKKIADRLGPSRDRVLAAKTMKALSKSAATVPTPNGQRCGGHDRTRRAESAEKRLEQKAIRQATNDFDLARRSFHRLRIDADGWAVIGPGLLKVYRQARRRMLEAIFHPSDLAFHRWRIRVKHLFYQLEWLEPVWPTRFIALHERLHELEEKLGADHDLVVLRNMLEKGTIFLGPCRGVKKSAKKKSGRLRRACKTTGARIFRKKPGKFGRECKRRWKAWKNDLNNDPSRRENGEFEGIFKQPRNGILDLQGKM